MDDDNELADLFILPEGKDHPAIIAERVLQLPEHIHLVHGEARIEWLFRTFEKVEAGRRTLGACHLPGVQGKLRDFFVWMCARLFGSLPDFLIILDKAYWDECTPREREILVFHELAHAMHAIDKYGAQRFEKETGRPVWAIKGHDVEEFTSVVARYGAWNDDLRGFLAAANEGGHV